MTYRPSSIAEHHRLQPADPVRTACALPFPAQPKAAATPKRTALAGSPAGFATVSGTWNAISRIPKGAVAPTVRALSP